MSKAFRPLQYDCKQQGCFNEKHRLKFGVFYGSLPGSISFSDVDAITEVAGNALIIEWKAKPGVLPLGQKIMFERLTTGKVISALCVAGDAETMSATHIAKFFDGFMTPWKEATTKELNDTIKRWADWSQCNSRLDVTYREAG